MSSRRKHPVFARMWPALAAAGEGKGISALRDKMLEGLHGRVVEIGAGSGTNFSHYPSSVSHVVAIEPEPYLRSRAVAAGARAGVPVSVLAAAAEEIPLASASMDAAVVSLVLCSVADQAGSIAEIRRVLRRGGELRFFEHVRSEAPLLARAQDLADLVWPRLGAGCHPNLDTQASIAAGGFEVVDSARSRLDVPWIATLVSPIVIGRALRDAGAAGGRR